MKDKRMEVVYNTSMYSVVALSSANKYLIINKATKIIEDEATKLPTAIGTAKAMQAAMLKIVKDDENEKA